MLLLTVLSLSCNTQKSYESKISVDYSNVIHPSSTVYAICSEYLTELSPEECEEIFI